MDNRYRRGQGPDDMNPSDYYNDNKNSNSKYPDYYNPYRYPYRRRQSPDRSRDYYDRDNYGYNFDQIPPISNRDIQLGDYGPEPFVVNIHKAAKQNDYYRTALWTGDNLQITLMSIDPGKDIGLEVHPELDQFIRIEEGEGIVVMGPTRNQIDLGARVNGDFAFVVPAGTWHNLINTGDKAIKLYSIYAPPKHPRGTIHKTKEEAHQ